LKKFILYDGWDLVYRPNSPAAIHLLTLLAAHPPEFGAAAALPGESFHSLPAKAELEIIAAPDTVSARLRWEQRVLPRLAEKRSAGLIHLVSGAPALFGGAPSVVSPAGTLAGPDRQFHERQGGGFADRLGQAVHAGGMTRARAVLWPADLPAPEWDLPVRRLPPVIHPAFYSKGEVSIEVNDRGKTNGLDALRRLELPETYVLYHGPTTQKDLLQLVDAWNWAGGAIGENFPLVLVGLDRQAKRNLEVILVDNPLRKTIVTLPLLLLDALAGVYQRCSVLLHPASLSPWGGSLRLALTCGKPLVSLEGSLTDALVGPGAYLISSEGASKARNRALGAAIITLAVEQELAEELGRAARRRAENWDMQKFSRTLEEVYRALLG